MRKHLFRGSLSICLAGVCLAGVCLAQSTASGNAGEAPSPPVSVAAPTPPAAPPPPAPAAQSASAAGPTGAAPVPAPIPQNPPKRKSGGKVAEPASAAPAKGSSAPYVIGPLDVLQIKVWNNPNLTGLVDVRPDGMFSMQLIGDIKADGLTVSALRDELKAKLGQYLTDPEVDIDVAKINSKRYYILGEGVIRPGAYPLTEPVTIMEALSSAGGFQAFANLKKIYLMRGTQKFPFNYKDVSQGKHLDEDIQIQNGDRIYVPQ